MPGFGGGRERCDDPVQRHCVVECRRGSGRGAQIRRHPGVNARDIAGQDVVRPIRMGCSRHVQRSQGLPFAAGALERQLRHLGMTGGAGNFNFTVGAFRTAFCGPLNFSASAAPTLPAPMMTIFTYTSCTSDR